MKMISKILVIIIIVLGANVSNAYAQKKRSDKTSSARAYYGERPTKPHSHNYRSKQKKTPKIKTARSQSAKRARADMRNRKKYS